MTHILDDNTGFDEPGSEAPEVTAAKERNVLAISQDMDRVKSSLNEFDRVSAGLAELEARYPKDAIYPVETTKGMKDAIEHRAAWRDPRILVEKARKMAKAPLLALGKNIDARAAWITEQLEAGEKPVDQQIKAEEKRREDERAARAAAEAARMQRIHEALAEISQNVTIACNKTSADIQALSEHMHATLPDADTFQEMLPQAKEAWLAGIAKLETSLKAKLWEEAEAERQAKERAAEEARRQEEAARLEAMRLEQARIAEEQRQAAEALAQQQRAIEAERQRLESERQARDRAEAERRARIAGRIEDLTQAAVIYASRSALEIEAKLMLIRANEPTEDLYGERIGEASSLRDAAIEALSVQLDAAKDKETKEREAAARVIPVAAPVAAVRPADPEESALSLKLGEINARLGFTVSGEFLESLGFSATQIKGAKLYKQADFGAICRGIAAHVMAVEAGLSVKEAA